MIKMLAGLFIVPIGLIFAKEIEGTLHPYRDYPELGNWKLVLLPDLGIFRPYQNLWDGAEGDKRGWYHNKFKSWPTFLRRCWWLAARNPVNYESRATNAFDIKSCETFVVDGYLPRVDEDDGLWGECKIRATNTVTRQTYFSYTKMVKSNVFKGYYWLWRDGYKFDLGDELNDFGHLPLQHDYEGIKALGVQYAKDGYRQGDAMKALDRLVPSTSRGFIPALKKINS